VTWRPDDRQRMTAEYRAALARLPDAYTLALRCADSGMSEDEICNQLGIEPESLEPLLELAYRKLHAELTRR
jgi:hypothetical protein